MIVLDSSALLAMLFFEPGCERVAELAPQSCMSTVNLAEVLGRLARDGRALDVALDQMEQMGIIWVDFDRELASGAAALLLPTVPWGLSLGDRACLALARPARSSGRHRRPRLGEARSRHSDRDRTLKSAQRGVRTCRPSEARRPTSS